MRFFISLILMMAGTLMVRGQDDAQTTKPTKPTPRQMRLVTVGERPPFRQEIRDGVRYEMPPPPGSLPPNEIDVGIPSEDENEEKAGSLRIRLGTITAPIEVPGGAGELVLRKFGSAVDKQPWRRIRRPESGDFIAILWRDPKSETWDEPAALVIPSKLAAGEVSFVNVAPGPVALVYGGERVALAPGKPLIRPLKSGKPQALQVGLPNENRLQRIVSRSLEQQAGQHSLVIFYRADGVKPRGPLGVKVIGLSAGAELGAAIER